MKSLNTAFSFAPPSILSLTILMSLLYHNDTIMKKEKEFTHDVGINQTKPILYTGKILMDYRFLIFFIICLCTSHASIMIFFSKSFSHLS